MRTTMRLCKIRLNLKNQLGINKNKMVKEDPRKEIRTVANLATKSSRKRGLSHRLKCWRSCTAGMQALYHGQGYRHRVLI